MMTAASRTHHVRFTSPGVFLGKETLLPIHSWDVAAAVELSKTIIEMHAARPFGFCFETLTAEPPAPDGMGSMFDVEPKLVERSGFFWLGGRLRSYDAVVSDDLPGEATLRYNMRTNKIAWVVENVNSYKYTASFDEGDVLLDAAGNPVACGHDAEIADYRNRVVWEPPILEATISSGWDIRNVAVPERRIS